MRSPETFIIDNSQKRTPNIVVAKYRGRQISWSPDIVVTTTRESDIVGLQARLQVLLEGAEATYVQEEEETDMDVVKRVLEGTEEQRTQKAKGVREACERVTRKNVEPVKWWVADAKMGLKAGEAMP